MDLLELCLDFRTEIVIDYRHIDRVRAFAPCRQTYYYCSLVLSKWRLYTKGALASNEMPTKETIGQVDGLREDSACPKKWMVETIVALCILVRGKVRARGAIHSQEVWRSDERRSCLGKIGREFW